MPVRTRYAVRNQQTNRLLGFVYCEKINGRTVVTAVDFQEVLQDGLAVPWNQAMLSFVGVRFGHGCMVMTNEVKEVDF
ncbi:MAG: hypothetical protein SAK29_18305 [Scytonema sp. PMC 1069.18]|nr:hypothetical protein [Scytonema sp. PMC 1069.18]